MNNQFLSLDPLFSLPIVAIIVLALFSFFGFKEFQRKTKFLALRIVALSLVMVSVLGVLLQPSYRNNKNLEPALLLTQGYTKNKVDSILLANPKLKVIRTKDALPYSGSSILKSWHDLLDENIFCVIGQGIPEHALDILAKKNFQFIPSTTPQGIIELFIPTDIHANDQRQIKGKFNTSEKTKLKLLGPGGAIDSANLKIGERSFSLSFIPKQAGIFMYSLVSEGLSGATSTERLPVEVLKEKQLRILFIQKFPTPEVRFLKNFLSEKHHQVAVRYQISKNNFIYEFANLPKDRIDNLRSDILSSYDLLFIDQKSYDEISAQEKRDLKKSINNGLGVIFLLNDAKGKALNEFLTIGSRISSKDTVHLHMPSARIINFPVLPVELAVDPSIIPITKNKNHILSGYFHLGLGKIGFQFIQEIFQIGMEGNIDDYASLWTPLISNTARSKKSNFKLKLVTPFPIYINEPTDITVISSGLQFSLHSDSAIVSMKENVLVDNNWTGRFWAGKSGWHQLYIKQDSTQLNYFVSDTTEWKALRISNQIKANQLYNNLTINETKKIGHYMPFPKFAFYFIFLFSSAFLWLAPKL